MLQRLLSSHVLNPRTVHHTAVATFSRNPTPACFATNCAGNTRSPMSKLLEVKDFGPAGFKWLTLKRIYVRPNTSSDLMAESSTVSPLEWQ